VIALAAALVLLGVSAILAMFPRGDRVAVLIALAVLLAVAGALARQRLKRRSRG
jgi:hypothetical protein